MYVGSHLLVLGMRWNWGSWQPTAFYYTTQTLLHATMYDVDTLFSDFTTKDLLRPAGH